MSRRKVLVVEDDADLRLALSLRLGAFGYEVVQAWDGAGAVSVASAERPDAVLLDLGLPGDDGVTVLERYAALPQLKHMPVVVLTGRDRAVFEPAVRALGVQEFLRKPADNDELRAALARATTTTPAAFDAPEQWLG